MKSHFQVLAASALLSFPLAAQAGITVAAGLNVGMSLLDAVADFYLQTPVASEFLAALPATDAQDVEVTTLFASGAEQYEDFLVVHRAQIGQEAHVRLAFVHNPAADEATAAPAGLVPGTEVTKVPTFDDAKTAFDSLPHVAARLTAWQTENSPWKVGQTQALRVGLVCDSSFCGEGTLLVKAARHHREDRLESVLGLLRARADGTFEVTSVSLKTLAD